MAVDHLKETSIATEAAAAHASDTVEKIEKLETTKAIAAAESNEELGGETVSSEPARISDEMSFDKPPPHETATNEFKLSKLTTSSVASASGFAPPATADLVPNLLHSSLGAEPIQSLAPPPQQQQPQLETQQLPQSKLFQPSVQLQLNQILSNELKQQ